MEELLKQIAKLDGFDLQIYAPSEKFRKPKKNEIKNLTENRKTKKIKFTEISQNFTTLCETDFYLSSLKEENVVEVIEENDEENENENFELDSSKLKQINRQELMARSDRNNENQLTRCFEKQLELFQGNSKSVNENVLLKIFTKNLSLCEDGTIQEKLNNKNGNNLKPFITLKSYPLLYEGVKDFMKEVLNEIDVILTEMESLWSRKRSQPTLQNIVTDLKRLRSVKNKQSFDSLVKITDAFKFNTQKFVFRHEVCEDLVQEALERIGANNYGPSKTFAQVLNKCFDSENENEEETETDEGFNKSGENVNEFVGTDIESVELEEETSNETFKVSLSVEDINKLQAAIKRKLREKQKNIK